MAIKMGHDFPSSFGFTGSSKDKSKITVRPHERRVPAGKGIKMPGVKKFADPGNALTQRTVEVAPTQRVKELSPMPAIRPGFKKGGAVPGSKPIIKPEHSLKKSASKKSGKLKVGKNIPPVQSGFGALAKGPSPVPKSTIAASGTVKGGANIPPRGKLVQNKRVGGPVAAKQGGLSQALKVHNSKPMVNSKV